MVNKKVNNRKFFGRRDFLKLAGVVAGGSILLKTDVFTGHKLTFYKTSYCMGNVVTFELNLRRPHDKLLASLAVDAAITEMKTIDRLMSVYNRSSQVSLINTNAYNTPQIVDERLTDILKQSQNYHKITNGGFNIMVGPLMEVFGFRADTKPLTLPDDSSLSKIFEAIEIDNLIVNERSNEITLNNPESKIDLGGIGVGYAIDRAVKILANYGIDSALINHSGDLFAIGSPPGEDYWEIGIVDPENTDDLIGTVKLKDQALATSGNYENYSQISDQRYGHIFYPDSLKPLNSYLSLSIIAPAAVDSDAFSTGFFASDAHIENFFINKNEKIKFFAVTSDGSINKNNN